MLTRTGIVTNVVMLPQDDEGADATPEFSLILGGWNVLNGDAASPLKGLIHTVDNSRDLGSANRGRYSNPEVDTLIEEALETLEPGKRAALLAKATELAIDDVALIPLHHQVNTWISRKGLKYRARADEASLAMDVYSE